MLIGDLVEELVTHISDRKAKWTTRTEPIIRAELDVLRCLNTKLGVYVLPGMQDYDISGSAKRGERLNTLNGIMFVSVILAVSFETLSDADGITSWEEAKGLVNERQRIEEDIIFHFFPEGLERISVESQPPEEIERDNRNFLVQTVFGYRQQLCNTQHELPST